MLKTSLLFLGLPLLAQAQTSSPGEPFALRHTVFAGVQVPLSYTAGYQAQFSRRFSARVQGGLIVPPFDRYTLKTLEGFGLERELSRGIDRAFRRGTSGSAGINVHADSPWYAGVFGQYVHLTSGAITPADALGVFFRRDISALGPLAALGSLFPSALVFNMQTNLGLGGLRVGRAFRFSDSRFGLNLEASLSKIFTTRSKFSSNRSLVDELGITKRLYADLDEDVDASLRKHGYLPTLDVLLTYRLGQL